MSAKGCTSAVRVALFFSIQNLATRACIPLLLADEIMQPTEWKVTYYCVIISKLLKKISKDTYCFPPGNNSLALDVGSLHQIIDEVQLAVVGYNSNIQPLYNILVTDFAVKAIGVIKKADLLFPGLLELFGKAQFLGKKYADITWHGTITGRTKS